MSNGLAFMVIQHYIPADEDSLGGYFTDVLFFAVGGFALLGMVSILTLTPFQVGKRWRDRDSESVFSDSFSSFLRKDDINSRETSPLLGGDRAQSYS